MAFPSTASVSPFLPAAARRGWGNPRRGMMTWRKTETETDRESETQRERQTRAETEKDENRHTHTDERGD